MLDRIARLSVYAPSRFLFRTLSLLREIEDGQRGARRVLALHDAARELIALGEDFALEGDLWQAFLAKELAESENPFSLACERGEGSGTPRALALRDCALFRALFHYDFRTLGADLDCFTPLRRYEPARRGQGEASRRGAALAALRDELAAEEDEEAFLARLAAFTRRNGAGPFAFYRAFRLRGGRTARLTPVPAVERVSLSDLIGYETQKKALRDNTEAFLAGRPANHALLYGDSGTGKSTCVRALLTDYADSPLRMVELRRHEYAALPALFAALGGRGPRFILFLDDLSFEEDEVEYKALKAAVEGALAAKPDNVLLYATSNRRHIVRETWRDRADREFDGDVHRSDTVEETLSLAARFGVTINFSAPNRAQYHEIVRTLAAEEGLPLPEGELLAGSNAWELRHGGVSGRTARQYIDYLAGRAPEEGDHAHTG